MTKEQRRKWLDSLALEQMAELRKAGQATREPWNRNRRENRGPEAYGKQRHYIVEDMRRGASLQVTAKRYDLDYGLLMALLIDDGLLVLRTDTGTGSTAEAVRV